jgi:hypothetical protein
MSPSMPRTLATPWPGSRCRPTPTSSPLWVASPPSHSAGQTLSITGFWREHPRFGQSDCLWLEAPEPILGAADIGHLVREYLPKHGIDPVQQVQVLCPTTRGEVGTRQLNSLLQQLLNPAKPVKAELSRGGSILRVGIA